MRQMLRVLLACSVVLAAPAARANDGALACDNFYDYVNGAWLADAKIAADRYRSGSFDGLRADNTRALLRALHGAQADPARLDTDGKRLALRYWTSGMDEAAIERAGLAPIEPLLAQIDRLDHREQLPALLGSFAQAGIAAPLAVTVGPDAKDKRRHRLSLYQSGLGLPDRDDYSRTDARTQMLRQALDRYQAQLLAAAGAGDDVAATVAAVRGFETTLAAASMTRVAQRDPKAVYNLNDAASLGALAPGFDWATYFAAIGLPSGTEVNVAQPAFARAVAQLASEAPLATWRAYLRLAVLDAAAPRLPRAFVEAHFTYHRGAIRGVEKAAPRAERLIEEIGGTRGEQPLGEALGELYVAAMFSANAKARAVAMVDDIRAALRARIDRLDWMSEPTRARAIAKLEATRLKIGYPDRWKRYDGLDIRAGDYAGNWLRANRWAFAQRLADLPQPVDRGRWSTSPYIVNAFAGSLNDIVFPAGILQKPFFDADADDAANYGAIGAVIGHEITHHFDDRGRQFDEHGNLADWWSAQDVAAYRSRTAKLAAQFSGYAPLTGQFINGEQTLGENISDLGGLLIAYDGLQRSRKRGGAEAGRAPEQRFFIAYATIWRDKMREAALLNQLRTGVHSPARYRVLGPLSNLEAFARAFDCPPDAPMVRADRVSIW